MCALNQATEPPVNYDGWVPTPKSKPTPRRWCPTHRTYEMNPPGRLMCGPAWAELYQMEREAEVEKMFEAEKVERGKVELTVEKMEEKVNGKG